MADDPNLTALLAPASTTCIADRFGLLIDGFSAALAAAGSDAEKLAALATWMTTNRDAVVVGMVSNTVGSTAYIQAGAA